jgi:hypothetical protein
LHGKKASGEWCRPPTPLVGVVNRES